MERPLTGEPLAVDLVNTRWREADGYRDALATTAGLASWLAERGIGAEATEPVRSALLRTRTTLRRIFAHEPGAEGELNAILAQAQLVRSLADGQVREHALFADAAWRPAWLAAADYLRLHEDGPDAIRQCEHPDCVLYFHDRGGRRRWCSMAGCGNRAKARRHYLKGRAVTANA